MKLFLLGLLVCFADVLSAQTLDEQFPAVADVRSVFSRSTLFAFAHGKSGREEVANQKLRQNALVNLSRQVSPYFYEIRRNTDGSILKDSVQNSVVGVSQTSYEMTSGPNGLVAFGVFRTEGVAPIDITGARIFSKVFERDSLLAQPKVVISWLHSILMDPAIQELKEGEKGRLILRHDIQQIVDQSKKKKKKKQENEIPMFGKLVRIYAAFLPLNQN